MAQPFRLTHTETRVLELKRQGLKVREIADKLGYKGHSSITDTINVAVQKEQLLAIHDKRESGETSLSKARGKIRMQDTK